MFDDGMLKLLLQDSSLTFAAKRQTPTRYNRETIERTVVAMKRISEIRQRREMAFYRNRMAGNKARALEAAKKLIEAENKYKQFQDMEQLDDEEMNELDDMEMSDEEMEDPEEQKAQQVLLRTMKRKEITANLPKSILKRR